MRAFDISRFTIMIALAGVTAGCTIGSLFSGVPDSPTRAEQSFADAGIYVYDPSADGYKKTNVYNGALDVPGAMVEEGTTKTGEKLYRPGKRAFIVDPWSYCRDIEQNSARASGWWAGLGIPSVAAGLPTAAAGTTLTIAEAAKTSPDTSRLSAAIGLAAGGYLLSLFGVYALDRSSAGAIASGEAGKAQEKVNAKEAYDACIEARATWLSSRERAIDDVKEERDHYRNLLEQRSTGDAGDAGDGGNAEAGDAATGSSSTTGPVASTDDAGHPHDAGKDAR